MGRRSIRWVVSALAGLLVAGSAGAVTIELVPSAPTAVAGTPFTVDVVVSGLGDFAAPAVGSFDIEVTYDPAVALATGVAFGPFLGDTMGGEAVTGTTLVPGSAMTFELSLLTPAQLVALQPGSFLLFTVSFDALIPGTTTFSTGMLLIGDEAGAPLPIDQVIEGSISVLSPVALEIPTLSTWALLLLIGALAAGAVLRLRRVRA